MKVFGCDECRHKDSFYGRELPYGTKGRGRSSCTLSSTGHLCVVEKAMAPLLRGVLGGSRFDTMVPLRRVRLAERGFTWAGLMTRGVVGRIEALVLDKLKAVRRIRAQVEHPERVCQVFHKVGAVEVRFLPPCRTVRGGRVASQGYE